MANPFDQFDELPARANPFDQFDASTPHASIPADIAQSLGSGAIRGAVGIPGVPGSYAEFLATHAPGWVQDAAASVRHWLAIHAGLDPEKVDRTLIDLNKRVSLPTSQDVIGAFERNVSGPLYQPKTRPGEYAETVGEFIPQAMATGAEGPIANLIKGAVAPAIGSEAAMDVPGVKGSWLETPARIIGGIVGSLGAHGAQTGINAANTAGHARAAARDIENIIGEPVTPGAVRRIAGNVEADRLTPQLAQQRMDALGPEGMMLDASRQLLMSGEKLATIPGRQQSQLLDAVENRTGPTESWAAAPGEARSPTAARVKEALNREMGASPDVVETENRIANIVDTHARPLYDSVMGAHPVVDVPEGITSRPAVDAAMRAAPEVALNYGEKLSHPVTQTVLNAGGVPVTQTVQQAAQPSLRYWDYVKKALDNRIKNYYTAADLTSKDKADLGGLQAARTALVNHLDAVTGGAYKTARQVAANKPQLTEALNDGMAALNTKLLPEQMRDIYENLSIPQQSMYRAGVRREVERLIDTARNDALAARNSLYSNQNYQKIETMFGPDAAEAIDRRIMAEAKFQKATQDIARGSQTARRLQAGKDVEDPSVATPPMANLTGFALKGYTKAREALGSAIMGQTRNSMGSMLTAPGDQVPDLVRILTDYNERAAANATPSVTPLARTLARVETMRAANEDPQDRQRQPLRVTVHPRPGYYGNSSFR